MQNWFALYRLAEERARDLRAEADRERLARAIASTAGPKATPDGSPSPDCASPDGENPERHEPYPGVHPHELAIVTGWRHTARAGPAGD